MVWNMFPLDLSQYSRTPFDTFCTNSKTFLFSVLEESGAPLTNTLCNQSILIKHLYSTSSLEEVLYKSMNEWYTNNSIGVTKVDPQASHCLNDGYEALNRVVMNHRYKRQTLFVCVSIFMNDSEKAEIMNVILTTKKNYFAKAPTFTFVSWRNPTSTYGRWAGKSEGMLPQGPVLWQGPWQAYEVNS